MVTKEETTRAKECALAQGVRVWELEQGKRYVALSSTGDGLAYEVVIQSREPGDITCSCPGATHRGICKHIGANLTRLEAEATQTREELEQKVSDLYR
jgi:uncharacterized Zn finger protein